MRVGYEHELVRGHQRSFTSMGFVGIQNASRFRFRGLLFNKQKRDLDIETIGTIRINKN